MRLRACTLLAALLLAQCSSTPNVEVLSLYGLWEAQGYTCREIGAPTVLRLEPMGSALSAVWAVGNDCTRAGEVSWLGEWTRVRLARNDLPFVFSVVVNLHEVPGTVRSVPGRATIETPVRIVVTAGQARYVLTRDSAELFDPTMATPSANTAADVGPMDAGSDAASETTAATQAVDAGMDAGADPVPMLVDASAPAASSDAGGSGGAAGRTVAEAGRSGSAGAAKSGNVAGGAGMAPVRGSSGQGGAGAGGHAGAPQQERPAPGWYCIDTPNDDGIPQCTCMMSGLGSDRCTEPKPTCCYVITGYCACWPYDSAPCAGYADGALGAMKVKTCPPL